MKFRLYSFHTECIQNFLLCNNNVYAACMTQSQLECKTIACKFANIAHNSLQQVQLQWWCIISHASEYKRIVINYKPCTRVNKWIGLWKSFSRQHEAKIFPTIWKNCSNLQKSECVLIKIHFEVVAKVSAIFKNVV